MANASVARVARWVTAKEYQGGLSAFHSAADALVGAKLYRELVSGEYSETRQIVLHGQTRDATLRSLPELLRTLNVPVSFFIEAIHDGVLINIGDEEASEPTVVYELRENLAAIYGYDVPLRELQEATSKYERSKLLRTILGPRADAGDGYDAHSISPKYYTQYAKRSQPLTGTNKQASIDARKAAHLATSKRKRPDLWVDYQDDETIIRFWFDRRVLDLYGVRSSVFKLYLNAWATPGDLKLEPHEVAWDIPASHLGGMHKPILSRHVQFAIRLDTPKIGMLVYSQIVHLVNTSGLVTNLIGALRISGKCSKDFIVRAAARIWLEVAGQQHIAASWTFAQAMMLTGDVMNTTTVRELHGKNFGHNHNNKNAGILAPVLGRALSGSKGNNRNVTYLTLTGAV